MFYEEHPFAEYVRILGKGKNGSRPLTEDEAYNAMKMILADEVAPEQLGAFLMLERIKEETPPELAGFVRATREALDIPDNMPAIDLDWSSYAGKKRQLPFYLLSALLLAENGIKVFMHGASGHTNGRVYTKDVLKNIGLKPCETMDEVADSINSRNFAYMDIEYLCPKLHKIIELRPLLGLRSPVHTLSRMINPFSAPFVMQGIFHPGYHPVHQETAQLLGEPNVSVVKGDGGEVERNPDMKCLVQNVRDGEMIDEEWPPMFEKRHIRDDVMDAERLAAIWNGADTDEYGIAAIIGTAAIALRLMKKAGDMDSAEALAAEMWNKRNPDVYGAAA